jgi:hypothetical protein
MARIFDKCDTVRPYYLAEFHGRHMEVDIFRDHRTRWIYIKDDMDDQTPTTSFIRRDEHGYWVVKNQVDEGPYPTRLIAYTVSRVTR